MQTFLPYPDFEESAKVLGDKRLNNQINENLILVRTLTGWYKDHNKYGKGWPDHPVTKMWSNARMLLDRYAEACLREYCRRGHDTKLRYAKLMEALYWPQHKEFKEHWSDHYRNEYSAGWLGNDNLHKQYRSILIQKKPEEYRDKFPNTPDNLELEYPV